MASCLSIKKGSNEKGNEGLEFKTSKQVHLVESKIVIKSCFIEKIGLKDTSGKL
jgi:hypothetical protein